jgi:hypothetical protein
MSAEQNGELQTQEGKIKLASSTALESNQSARKNNINKFKREIFYRLRRLDFALTDLETRTQQTDRLRLLRTEVDACVCVQNRVSSKSGGPKKGGG